MVDHPPKKSGFKGKRPKAKFSRNLNTGEDRKQSVTFDRFQAAVRSGAVTQNDRSIELATAALDRDRPAARKARTKDLKAALKQTSADLKKTKIALAKEEKKRTRAEVKSSSVSEAIKVARKDARDAKNQSKILETKLKRTENALASERSLRVEDSQAWEAVLLKKEEEYNLFLREEIAHVKQRERKHASEERNALERNYRRQFDSLSCHFTEAIQSVAKEFRLKLENMNNKLMSADDEIHAYKEKIDSLKISHKDQLRRIRKQHGELIESKNREIIDANELISGMQAMFYEMSDEVVDANKSSRLASDKMLKLKEKAAAAHHKYIEHKLLSLELKDEVRDKELRVSELELEVSEFSSIVDYLYEQVDQQRQDFDSIVEYIDKYYAEEMPKPKLIAKHYVPNKDGKGKHSEWLPHVDKLIIEMLAHRTPPTCIQANIYAMTQVILPQHNIVQCIPSLKHIKNLRTVASIMTKNLAAYELGFAQEWLQWHNDETRRRQVSMIDSLIQALKRNGKVKTVAVDIGIIAKNGTAEEQSRALIGSLVDMKVLLQDWRDETALKYPTMPSLLDEIPHPDKICPTRLLGVMIEHDTCNTAESVGEKLENTIKSLAAEKGIPREEIVIYQGDCHNHMRNIWVDHIEKYLGSKLTEHLKDNLKLVPSNLRVSCHLSDCLIQVDKEYNLNANYTKGHGDEFGDWWNRCHPGKRRLPIIRVSGGNRQDAAFEGALPVYDSLDEMLQFTLECLRCGSDNQLQRCLFLIMSSMEFVAQLRVASIFFFAVIVPMRWLAGNTHKLAHRNWGERSMSKAIDLLHTAFKKVAKDGRHFLDYNFIMNIFQPLYEQLPELRDYLDFFKEDKLGNVAGSYCKGDRVPAMEQAMTEVFWPTKTRNRETTQFCRSLSVGIAVTLLTEMEHAHKATSKYLSAVMGKCSQAVITNKEEMATLGRRANNDPSEGAFATLTDILQYGGRISLQSAAALGQMRYNKDMSRNVRSLVTGRRSKNVEEDSDDDGTFHTDLNEYLQDSLLSIAKKKAACARKTFQIQIEQQRVDRSMAKRNAMEASKEKTVTTLVNAMYLHEQYFSPACWKTVNVARKNFAQLKTKKDKLSNVKDQILMRYIGLGWEEAHHPWSHKGIAFTPEELFEHLITVVIPLQKTKTAPSDPPTGMPKIIDSDIVLGTKSAARRALDEKVENEENEIRKKARRLRDVQEQMGLADREEFVQETVWPVNKIKPGFAVQICWKYFDESDGVTEELRWCCGVVQSIVRDKSNDKSFFEVMVLWNDEFVEPGMVNPTCELLKKNDYNPKRHYHGAWRADMSELRTVELI